VLTTSNDDYTYEISVNSSVCIVLDS